MKKSTLISLCIGLAFSGILHAQQWQQKTDIPFDARHHPITWSINGFGYLLGGTSGNTVATAARKDFYRYDPANDSWTQLSDYPGPGRAYSISATYQGKAYVGFGATVVGTSYQPLNDLWSYDPQTGTWTQLADCPCTGRLHPTFTINAQYGKLYVGQGNNTSNLKDWWEYDIATDTWTQKTDFPGTARHHPYHFSIGQYSYSGFGHDNSVTMAREDWYRYDPATDTWDQMADAPDGIGRIAGQQFTYAGYGFVIDGDGSGHQSTNPSIFWKYDPAMDTWDELNPHPGNSIWAPGLFEINGIVYLISGSQDYANAPFYSSVWATDLNAALSTSKYTKQSISVYPNPTRDVLHISSASELENSHFGIYSVEGKLLMKDKTGEQIDVSNLSSGMYILKLTDTTSGNTQHLRFVKH